MVGLNQNKKFKKPQHWPDAVWKYYLGNKWIANSRTHLLTSVLQNLCFRSIQKFSGKKVKLVFFNAQQVLFLWQDDCIWKISSKISWNHIIRGISSNAWSMRQHHRRRYFLSWKLQLIFRTFSCWKEDSLDTYWILHYFTRFFTGFLYWITLTLFHAVKYLFAITVPEIESLSKCNLISLL